MATQGPTATTYDASTFSHVKDWAGSVQGINAALAAFGWLQTSDSNQIDWTNATVAPFGSSVFPNTVLATSATAGGPVSPYLIKARGTWAGNTTLSSVANASGGSTVYTGTITGGGSNAFAGSTFVITGFTSTNNNGTFLCTASTTTTLTLNNAAGTSETHAATATAIYNYLDVVRSTGGTGNDYILSRTPSVVTNVSVTAGVATITAANNYTAGEVVMFPHITAANFLQYISAINNTYTVLASGLSSSSFQINVTGSPYGNQPETYPSTAEGTATNTPSLATIVVTSTTRPETDTKNYVPYYYEMWKTADSQTYAETAQSVSYVASSATLTVNTNTTPNRLNAGFNITISGATNLPQINGTWCVNSATTTQLTFVIPNSVSGFSGDFSGTDTFTITYTLQPIYMRLEYWNNTGATNAPWIRVAVGTGTDGVGNLVGVRSASDTPAATAIFAGTSGYGNQYSGLVASSSNPAYDARLSVTSNTSTIWRNIWSGANNRFGTAMFYNRNDTNAPQSSGGSAMWIVERGLDPTGNYLDDYFTLIAGGSTSTQTGVSDPILIRYYLKPNPKADITTVYVDGSNNATIGYNTNAGYHFEIGSIVYVLVANTAGFLTGQFIRVDSTSFTLTSVATSVGSSAVYTGTIPGGANNNWSGYTFVVSGFTNGVNNGTFSCTASSATTLTLSNAAATSETHAALATSANGNPGFFTGVIAAHATYGPTPDTGRLRQSTSLTTFTPIAGTGDVTQVDYNIPTVRSAQTTLTFNGNTPLLPVFPLPGYVGNPMTMGMSCFSTDGGLHDTMVTITLYGATRTYYQPQGSALGGALQPYSHFGNGLNGTMTMFLRWD